MAERLDDLEQHLEMFIESSRQLGIIASDFQPQGQNVLNGKMYVCMTNGDVVLFIIFVLHLQ